MKRVLVSLDLKQQPPSFFPKQHSLTSRDVSLMKNWISQTCYIELPGDENSHAIFIHVTTTADSNHSVAEKVSIVNSRLSTLNLGVSRVSQYHLPLYDSCVVHVL